jgi:hypothetical protein
MLDARYWIRLTVQEFNVQRFRIKRSTQNAEPKTENAYPRLYNERKPYH